MTRQEEAAVLLKEIRERAEAFKAADYTVGQAVEVHAFGRWYAGKVVKIGKTKVHAEYTSGTGTTRVKACGGWTVRKTA